MIAATVWQFGIYAPLAQISDRMAFVVEGDTLQEGVVNTDASWQVEQEFGHSPKRPLPEGMWQYWAAGPGEQIDANRYDWNWKESVSGPRSHWVSAAPAIRESIYPDASAPAIAWKDAPVRWRLVPDSLPPMEYREVDTGKVVRTTLEAAREFPARPTTIPAHSSATILIDHGTVLSAYPELTLSGGRGAHIEIAFAEALDDAKGLRANRNEIKDRVLRGLNDEFIADGSPHETYTPLWWRTWRYFELRINTEDEPLELQRFRTYYTAYPFVERGSFESSDPDWRASAKSAGARHASTPTRPI